MSVKSRLRGLETSVEWLMQVGRYRGWATMIDIIDRKQEMSDFLADHPNFADRFGGAEAIECLNLPPPRRRAKPEPAPSPEPIFRDATLRIAPQDEGGRVAALPPPPPALPKLPEPTKPHPEEPSEARRQSAFEGERSKRPEGSEPAPRLQPILRDAALQAAPQDEVVRVETPMPPKPPPPPEPELVQPFNYDPPPEMQIRPVTCGGVTRRTTPTTTCTENASSTTTRWPRRTPTTTTMTTTEG